jgi:aminoglycoside 3-N-acetyltransferase
MESTTDMERLARDLRDLGVTSGATLMVHSSLSAIGWVEGGASVVVRALIEALGEDGTLAMPASTPNAPCRNL